MSTQESLSRIESERKDPKADIFLGGTCDVHVLMKKENLSEKYISENYDSIPEKYKDREGYWIGFEVSLYQLQLIAIGGKRNSLIKE